MGLNAKCSYGAAYNTYLEICYLRLWNYNGIRSFFNALSFLDTQYGSDQCLRDRPLRLR